MTTWAAFTPHARHYNPLDVLRQAQQQSAQTVNKPRVVGTLAGPQSRGERYAAGETGQEPISSYAERRG